MSLVEKELLHRLDILAKAQTLESWPLLSPGEVRELGIYGGASGVWSIRPAHKNLRRKV